jgi:hypothetical protein
MEALYHIFGYLKAHDRSTMVFDDAPLLWKDSDFHPTIVRNFIPMHEKKSQPTHHL